MDDGNQGPFTSILVTSSRSFFIVTSGVQIGLQYRFRYHVGNVNGWSDYSDISYITAFAPPEAPPAPTFNSGTDTSVTLNFFPSRNDHGIRVANYELYIDMGNNATSEFRLVPAYSAFLQTFTLTVANANLSAPGTTYRVKVLAVNQIDIKSEFSNEFVFKLGSLPS
jgi:hypothetical protein